MRRAPAATLGRPQERRLPRLRYRLCEADRRLCGRRQDLRAGVVSDAAGLRRALRAGGLPVHDHPAGLRAQRGPGLSDDPGRAAGCVDHHTHRGGRHAGQRRRVSTPGVAATVAVAGYNIVDGIQQPNAGIAFIVLEPWDQRTTAETSAPGILAALQKKYNQIAGASVIAANAPPIMGLSATGGFNFERQDLNDAGIRRLPPPRATWSSSQRGDRS